MLHLWTLRGRATAEWTDDQNGPHDRLYLRLPRAAMVELAACPCSGPGADPARRHPAARQILILDRGTWHCARRPDARRPRRGAPQGLAPRCAGPRRPVRDEHLPAALVL